MQNELLKRSKCNTNFYGGPQGSQQIYYICGTTALFFISTTLFQGKTTLNFTAKPCKIPRQNHAKFHGGSKTGCGSKTDGGSETYPCRGMRNTRTKLLREQINNISKIMICFVPHVGWN